MVFFQKHSGMCLIAFALLNFINLIASQDAGGEQLPGEDLNNVTLGLIDPYPCGETGDVCGPFTTHRCCHQWVCTGFCVPWSWKPRDGEVEELKEKGSDKPECPNTGCAAHACPCGAFAPLCCPGFACAGFCVP